MVLQLKAGPVRRVDNLGCASMAWSP